MSWLVAALLAVGAAGYESRASFLPGTLRLEPLRVRDELMNVSLSFRFLWVVFELFYNYSRGMRSRPSLPWTSTSLTSCRLLCWLLFSLLKFIMLL